MKKVMDWLKKIKLGRTITVFLSGLLLLVSTACGPSNVLAKTADQVREEVPEKAITNTYEGGINQYGDTDPRRDTSRVEQKAQTLVEQARQNIETKGVDSPEQYGENYRTGTPLNERVNRLGEDVKSSTEELTEGVTKGTQKGLENVKENAKNALEGTKGAVQSKVSSDIQTTKQTVQGAADNTKEIGNKAKGVVENASQAVKEQTGKIPEAGKDIGERAKGALENASNAVKEKINKGVEALSNN
jgi:ElaB/YqjD/DUF883 family membrane-anchored ribosome-binding protein